MSIDLGEMFDAVEKLASSDKPVAARMGEIIDKCARDFPHKDWQRFASLDYEKDVSALATWIADVFKKQPAPFQTQGLWVGLCNPANSMDDVWADMYVASMAQYDPDDKELGWLWSGERHYPDNARANSPSLRSIYKISYSESDGLGNDAEYPLCLAFAVFALSSLLRHQTPSMVGSTASRVGVAVGFDSGDMLRIGELTANGLQVVA